MSEIPLNSRVALRNGADSVYIYALPGTEGWVREYKEDDDGFEMIRVEWDKSHWRYNGQPDGWTFASHFNLIGPPSEVKEIEEPEETGDLDLEMIIPPSEDEVGQYMEILTEAMDAASESEGFLMIAIRRIPNPDNPKEVMFAPAIFQHAVSKESAMLLDVQIAEMAGSNYQEMIFNMIQSLGPGNE